MFCQGPLEQAELGLWPECGAKRACASTQSNRSIQWRKAGIRVAWLFSMSRKNQICTLSIRAGDLLQVQPPGCPTRQRLAKSFSLLQDLHVVRTRRQDPHFEKPVEERIIWRELLELELQAVDEKIERISASAADGSDKPKDGCV